MNGRRIDRITVTCLWLLTWPVLSVLMLPLGLVSMKALGRALEQTGKNLQEYHW